MGSLLGVHFRTSTTWWFAAGMVAAVTGFALHGAALGAAVGPAQATATPTETSSLVAPGALVEKLTSGYAFTEGPAVASDGTLFFSDVQHSRIHKLSPTGQVTVHRSNTERSNGLYFDADGSLVVCVMGGHRVVRDDLSGGIEVIADTFDGAPLVAPNDVWIHPNGGIYFTDPDFQGVGQSSVFYLPPDGGDLVRVVSDLQLPNGVIGTPDGDTLYIADYGGHTWRYRIEPDGMLGQRSMLSVQPGDGMTLDERGNVYVASGSVIIHAPDGTEIESIDVPEEPSNVTFGGPDGRTLYITAQTSVYSIRMTVRGAFAPPALATATPSDETPTMGPPEETETPTATATTVPITETPSPTSTPTGTDEPMPVFLPIASRGADLMPTTTGSPSS